MASFEDVRAIALELPQASERTSRGRLQWRVADKLFVWERPLSEKEQRALGDCAPRGAILGARVEHLIAKEALLASDPERFFTTPHFNGYPAVLLRMELVSPDVLHEVVIEAWLCRAPKRAAERYLEAHLPEAQAARADVPPRPALAEPPAHPS